MLVPAGPGVGAAMLFATSGVKRSPIDARAVVMDVGGGVELLIAIHDPTGRSQEGCALAMPGYVAIVALPSGPPVSADSGEWHYASMWLGIGAANILQLMTRRASVPRPGGMTGGSDG